MAVFLSVCAELSGLGAVGVFREDSIRIVRSPSRDRGDIGRPICLRQVLRIVGRTFPGRSALLFTARQTVQVLHACNASVDRRPRNFHPIRQREKALAWIERGRFRAVSVLSALRDAAFYCPAGLRRSRTDKR